MHSVRRAEFADYRPGAGARRAVRNQEAHE
jgi:hypothetical protein